MNEIFVLIYQPYYTNYEFYHTEEEALNARNIFKQHNPDKYAEIAMVSSIESNIDTTGIYFKQSYFLLAENGLEESNTNLQEMAQILSTFKIVWATQALEKLYCY